MLRCCCSGLLLLYQLFWGVAAQTVAAAADLVVFAAAAAAAATQNLEGAEALRASGLVLQSPVTSEISAAAAAAAAGAAGGVGASALAADVAAATAAAATADGMQAAPYDSWLPHWLRVRSSLLPDAAAAAAKQQEGAQLLLPSALLQGSVRLPARCRLMLSLGLRLLLQQPQLLHSNPQNGISLGGAFAAIRVGSSSSSRIMKC